jgi:hypothetical protein
MKGKKKLPPRIQKDHVLFRASSAGALMVGGSGWSEKDEEKLVELRERKEGVYKGKLGFTSTLNQRMLTKMEKQKKAIKDAGGFILGKTAKTMIEDLFVGLNYQAIEPVVTPQMLKGHAVESDSVKLHDQVFPEKGQYRALYRDGRKFNEWFIGKPDLLLPKIVEDYKSSWNLLTFFRIREEGLNPLYFGQGQVYMDIFKKEVFRLVYCLVSTPAWILEGEEKRLFAKFGYEDTEDYQEAVAQLHSVHIVDHIPAEHRVKVFEFERDDEYLRELKYRVKYAREYYDTLSLNMK